MDGQQHHGVRRLVYEIETDDPGLARELQSALGRMQRTRLTSALQRALDRCANPARVQQIERLELDLGAVAVEEFEDEFALRVERALERELRRALAHDEERRGPRDGDDGDEAAGEDGRREGAGPRRPLSAALEELEQFARTSTLPWWSRPESRATLDARARELGERAPESLARLLRSLRGDDHALARIATHYADSSLDRMTRALGWPSVPVVLGSASLCRALAQVLRATPGIVAPARRWRAVTWQAALTVAATRSPAEAPAPGSLVRSMLAQLSRLGAPPPEQLVRAIQRAASRASDRGAALADGPLQALVQRVLIDGDFEVQASAAPRRGSDGDGMRASVQAPARASAASEIPSAPAAKTTAKTTAKLRAKLRAKPSEAVARRIERYLDDWVELLTRRDRADESDEPGGGATLAPLVDALTILRARAASLADASYATSDDALPELVMAAAREGALGLDALRRCLELLTSPAAVQRLPVRVRAALLLSLRGAVSQVAAELARATAAGREGVSGHVPKAARDGSESRAAAGLDERAASTPRDGPVTARASATSRAAPELELAPTAAVLDALVGLLGAELDTGGASPGERARSGAALDQGHTAASGGALELDDAPRDGARGDAAAVARGDEPPTPTETRGETRGDAGAEPGEAPLEELLTRALAAVSVGDRRRWRSVFGSRRTWAALRRSVERAARAGVVDPPLLTRLQEALVRKGEASGGRARLFELLRDGLGAGLRGRAQELARADEEDEERRARARQPESVIVEDAGLVLLWPFLGHFFTYLGLMRDKQFVDARARDRGVGLLRSVATGTREPMPYELPLAKILCGLELEDVVDFGPPVSDEEDAECQRLLQAVIQRASVLGDISVGGLRGSFLVRPGLLSARDELLLLRVEQAGHDIILERLPWSFELVKLSWMEAAIQIEW